MTRPVLSFEKRLPKLRRGLAPVFLLLMLTCSKSPELQLKLTDGNIRVLLEEGKTNFIKCYTGDSLTSTWPLRYPVFAFQKGDINGDGNEDILVGVVKKTRRDRISRKRLFLFQVRNHAIIPLWLGSSLGHELEDFIVANDGKHNYVRALQKDEAGRYLIGEYEWLGFGMHFRRYIARGLSQEDATQKLHE